MEADGDLSGHKNTISVISQFLSGNFASVLRERQRESVINKSSSELEIIFLRMLLLAKPSSLITERKDSGFIHKSYYSLINQCVLRTNNRKSKNLLHKKDIDLQHLSAFLGKREEEDGGYLQHVLFTDIIDERLNSYSKV